MRLAKVISLIGVLAMGGVITWAFASGNFSEEGGKLSRCQPAAGTGSGSG